MDIGHLVSRSPLCVAAITAPDGTNAREYVYRVVRAHTVYMLRERADDPKSITMIVPIMQVGEVVGPVVHDLAATHVAPWHVGDSPQPDAQDDDGAAEERQ